MQVGADVGPAKDTDQTGIALGIVACSFERFMAAFQEEPMLRIKQLRLKRAIAKEAGISEKTTTRRLNRMKEMRLLDFSLQCSPAAMIGYIQFAIPITVAKSHYQNVRERMYSEFQANILYSPSVIQPEDQLTFVLFGENVFVVDYVLARVNSFAGVKNADAYILTKWQYYDDWIMKEINNRLLLRPVLHRSR